MEHQDHKSWYSRKSNTDTEQEAKQEKRRQTRILFNAFNIHSHSNDLIQSKIELWSIHNQLQHEQTYGRRSKANDESKDDGGKTCGQQNHWSRCNSMMTTNQAIADGILRIRRLERSLSQIQTTKKRLTPIQPSSRQWANGLLKARKPSLEHSSTEYDLNSSPQQKLKTF